jgi:regulator of protease activity HflC (stomatin/prohibitin superfamily)
MQWVYSKPKEDDMGFGILLIIAGVAALVAAGVNKQFGGFRGLGIASLGLGILIFVAAQAFVSVPVGSVAVVVNRLSGLKPDALNPGAHIVLPGIETPFYYNTRLQELTLSRRGEGGPDLDESIKALSREGLEISADVTVQFQIVPSTAPKLHQNIGTDYVNVVIRPQVRSKVRDSIGQFNAADLISTKRKALENNVIAALEGVFKESNLELKAVLLRELRIPDSVAKAIEEKQTAEQRVQTEKNNRDAERIRADTVFVTAQGAAKAAVARAKGEAQALSLRGAALKNNPQLIQLTVAEKLAPTVQTIMMPSTGNFLLNLDSLTKNAKP